MLVHNVMFKFWSKNVPELSLKQILGSNKFYSKKFDLQKIPKVIRSKKMLVQKVRFEKIRQEIFCPKIFWFKKNFGPKMSLNFLENFV